MKGLILKDFYLIWNSSKFIIIAAIIMMLTAVESNYMLFYAAMIICTIPSKLLSYDENDKWDEYSKGMPLSDIQIVSARYIVEFISIIFIILLYAIVSSVYIILDKGLTLETFLQNMSLEIMAGTLIFSLPMPFMYKFGSNKGRIMLFTLAGFFAAVSAVIVTDGFNFIFSALQHYPAYIFIIVLSVVINIISWIASIWCYRHRKTK